MRKTILCSVLVLVPALASAQKEIRYYPPSLADGGTITGPLLLPAGTATAPSLAFSADPTDGFYRSADDQITWAAAGGARWTFQNYNFMPALDDDKTIGTTNRISALGVTRYIHGSKSKTLTDAAAAVSFVRIAVPTNANMGGKLIYTATSTDGANGSLTSTAEYNFSGADIAGTVTCGISAQLGVATAYARANTLVCTVTTVTATTNCDLQVTCTDNKAAAQTVTLNWRLDMPIFNTVTPQ